MGYHAEVVVGGIAVGQGGFYLVAVQHMEHRLRYALQGELL